MVRFTMHKLRHAALLLVVWAVGCVPLLHRGSASVVRLDTILSPTTPESLHLALTVVNRSSDEVWVRVWDAGPAVSIRDARGNERCIPPAPPLQVVVGGEIVVHVRLAPGATATLRRSLSLRQLAHCGPGRVTITARTEIIRPRTAGPPFELSRSARLTLPATPSAG